MKKVESMTIKKMLQLIALPVLLLFSITVWSQQVAKVTGTVTDADGKALEGVSVTIKGSNKGTATGTGGVFTLDAPSNATLVFSSVGFAVREVKVTGGNMTIALAAAANDLNAVVVIGYGSARKKDLTGAVSTVTSKDFQKGNIVTPEQAIAGKVAGVSIISNGGRPGAGSTIRIRGGASLNASNDPLIVVDGVPLDGGGIEGAASPLSLINPNDIESYTVLKDASAAAIYGSRANNGVIIITTKKGKGGGLKVNFSSVNSLAQITKTIGVLTGDQIREIVAAQGSPLQKAQVGTANTNWQDEIYQTGLGTDNNITLSGGVKGLPYRLTMGYFDQSGILRTDRLRKTSVSLAVNPTFFKNHLKVDLNLKGAAQKTRFSDDGAIGTAVGFDPTQPVYETKDNRYGGFYQWRDATTSNGLVTNRANNPVAMLMQSEDIKKPNRLIGNIQVDYKFHFLPELRANVNVAYDVSRSTGQKTVSDSAAPNYTVDANGRPNGGLIEPKKQERRNSVFDFYLNYAKDLKSIKSRIDVTAGYSYNNFYTKNYNIRSTNLKGDTIAGSSAPGFPFDAPENTLISYFGRLLYNYDGRYFLTASVRRDGSSRFIKENRWGWFPSVGVAWSLKEDFLKNSRDVSELKVRLGYGLTGQQDGIGNYDFLARYSLGGGSRQYQFGNAYYFPYGPAAYNASLKWEELSSYNLALDFGFLDGRISGSIDLYNRESKDLLVRAPQPTGTNFTPYINANVGNMINKGVEVTLNTQVYKQKDFSWDIGLNVTYNHNRITKLTTFGASQGLPVEGADAVNGFTQLQQVGYSRNTFYLYQQVYDKNGQPIEGLFEDRNRDGIITAADKYLTNTAAPDLLFGFNTTASYKQFTLGTVLRANFNNYVYNNIFSNRGRLNQVLGAYILGNASSYYTETKFAGTVDVQPLSDMYIENASFLKMDNLYLAYNVGKILKNSANLRLTGSVQNVFVATKYRGLDPEQSSGVDRNLYPRPRTYALAINLDF
jgi:TonB-linked SusC/RagA family outer membrane protein